MNNVSRLLAAALTTTISLSAVADPISDARAAFQAKDHAKVIRILDQAAKAGDQSAKAWLANYLRALPDPHRDVARACALALEAGNAGNPMGAIIRTECMVAGTVKVEQPWLQARDLAKKAARTDEASAGLVRYLAYTMDPQYSYTTNGFTDKLRYDTLAKQPLSGRTDQIESINGLSAAMGSGLVSSYVAALGYLLQTVAPSNMKRAVNVATLVQSSGNRVPEYLMPAMKIAAMSVKMGATHTSPMVFSETVKTVFPAAATKITRSKQVECQATDVQPKRLVASAISSPVYLPVKVGALVDTYLISGTWTETWTLAGCGAEVDIKINFTADGWGGAKFKVA